MARGRRDRRDPSTGRSRIADRELILTAIGGAIVLVVLLVTLALPFLDATRRTPVEVPQSSPLFEVSLVELLGGQRACADQIDLLPGRQVAEMRVGTFGKPPSRLLMTLTGPGYSERITLPPTYVDNGAVDAPFAGPAKPLEGHVCVTNEGRRRLALYASADRTKSRSRTLVAGRPTPANFDLTFYAAKPKSLLDRASSIIGSMRLFRVDLGSGLLWLLAFLFAVAVPLVSIVAVAVTGDRPRGGSGP